MYSRTARENLKWILLVDFPGFRIDKKLRIKARVFRQPERKLLAFARRRVAETLATRQAPPLPKEADAGIDNILSEVFRGFQRFPDVVLRSLADSIRIFRLLTINMLGGAVVGAVFEKPRARHGKF